MPPADPPPTLDYAKPASRPAARIDRRTAISIFIVDVIVLAGACVLAALDIQSWLIALPALLLNLPALPLACVFSMLPDGRSEPNTLVGVVRVVAMFLCEAIFSSIVWGWIAARLRDQPMATS